MKPIPRPRVNHQAERPTRYQRGGSIPAVKTESLCRFDFERRQDPATQDQQHG